MAFEEISIALWYVFFVFSGIFGVVMVRKALGEGLVRSQREYYLGIAIFIIVHLFARIFYFIFDFYSEFDQFYWDLGAIVGIAGIVFMVYAIERYIYTRSRFFFTTIAIISVILLILAAVLNFPLAIKNTVQSVVVPAVGLFIPLIYLYVAYKGSGEIRKNSLIIFVGIFVFVAGQTAHMSLFLATNEFIYFVLSPVFMIVGGGIFLYGLIKT